MPRMVSLFICINIHAVCSFLCLFITLITYSFMYLFKCKLYTLYMCVDMSLRNENIYQRKWDMQIAPAIYT